MVLDCVGLAVAHVNAAVELFLYLKDIQEAHNVDAESILSLRDRVVRIQNNIHKYEDNSISSNIPDKVVQRVIDDFEKVNGELEKLKAQLTSKPEITTLSMSRNSAGKLDSISLLLTNLEDLLDTYGLMFDLTTTLQVDLTAVSEAVSNAVGKQAEQVEKIREEHVKQPGNSRMDESQNMLSYLTELKLQLSIESGPKFHSSRATGGALEQMLSLNTDEKILVSTSEMPEGVRSLPEKLSTSGMSEATRHCLLRHIISAYDGWQIRDDDLIFDQKKNGRNIVLGSGRSSDVYKALLKRKDGASLRVAVKQMKVLKRDMDLKVDVLPDLFFQMDCKHNCILHTYGAHWPEHDGDDSNLYSAPYMVTERMTSNLRTACRDGLISSKEMQTRVLLDVARALAYLHERKVVHGDVKPEKVLLRVVNGEIIGNAKISVLSISRSLSKNCENTGFGTRKEVQGTLSVMPPEILHGTEKCPSERPCDVWSFGLLICFSSSTRKDSFAIAQPTVAQKMVDPMNEMQYVDNSVANIPDRLLQEVARACLRRNADQRPVMASIEQVLSAKCWGPEAVELLGPPDAPPPELHKSTLVERQSQWNKHRNAELREQRHCAECSANGAPWRREHPTTEQAVTLLSGLEGIFQNFVLQAPLASTLPVAIYCFTCGAPAQALERGLQEIVCIGEHPVLSEIRCSGCRDPCWFVDREHPDSYVS